MEAEALARIAAHLRAVNTEVSDLTAALVARDAARERAQAAAGSGFRVHSQAIAAYLLAQAQVLQLTPAPVEDSGEPVAFAGYDLEEIGYETVPAPRESIYSEDELADLRSRGRDIRGL